MPKLCICVSGQMRAMNASLERLKSALGQTEATLIFSVWDRVGRKLDGALNIHQMSRVLDPDAQLAIPSDWLGYQHFWTALPLLRQDIEATAQSTQAAKIDQAIRAAFPAAIVDIESADLLDLDFPHPVGEDRHSMRLLYKIWRVNKIKRRLEREAGPFDVVLRIRPDLSLSDVDFRFVQDEVLRGRFLVGYWGEAEPWCSDNFAAGSSRAMDKYSALFSRAIEEPPRWEHIHIDLASHLRSVGIHPSSYRNCELLVGDELIGVPQLKAAVDRMEGHAAWTVRHAATAGALAASSHLRDGQAGLALEVLLRTTTALMPLGRTASDGCFLVLARAFSAADAPELAAVCALISGTWEEHCEFHRGEVGIDCIIGAVVRAARGPGAPALALDLAAVSRQLDRWPAFKPLLEKAVQPASAAEWLPQAMRFTANQAFVVLRRMTESGHAELADLMLVPTIEALAGDTARVARTPGETVALERLLRLALGRPIRTPDQELFLLQRLAELTPDDVQLMYRIADLSKRQRRFAEAAQWQLQALEREPMHDGARRQMAEILVQLGQLDAARAHAEQALALHPSPEHQVLVDFIAFLRAGVVPDAASRRRAGAQADVDRYSELPRFAEFSALAGIRPSDPG